MNIRSATASMSAPRQESLERMAFWLAMSVVFVLAFVLRQSSLLNHDSSWYLYSTARFLEGARLYVDIIEINPPLSFFLTVPPVALAKAFSLEPRLVFYSYFFILAAVSLWVSSHLLSRFRRLARGQVYAILLVSAIALLLLPAQNFGQREHLAMIFTWPYMVLLALRTQKIHCDWRMAVFVGGLAFFGFGLKPHFLLVPVALEAYHLFRTRKLIASFRPETLTLASALVAYLLVIYLFTPEYLSHIVPYAMAVYNQAFRTPLAQVFFPAGIIPLLFLYLCLRAPLNNAKPVTPLVNILLVAGVAYFFAYLFQRKGWSYQTYPAMASLYAASIILLIGHVRDILRQYVAKQQNYVEKTVWLGLMAALLFYVPFTSIKHSQYRSVPMEFMTRAGAFNKPISSFFVFSTNLSAGFPLVNEQNLHWSSRFPTQWLLPGIMRARHELKLDATSHDKAAIDAIESYNKNAVITDLLRHPPDLIAVDARNHLPYFGELTFDFLAYYKQDRRFKEFWRGYEKFGEAKIYHLYRRRTQNP